MSLGNIFSSIPTPLVFNLGELERESDFWFLDNGFHKQICEVNVKFLTCKRGFEWLRKDWLNLSKTLVFGFRG